MCKWVGRLSVALALLSAICFAGNTDIYEQATAGQEPVIGAPYFGTHFHRIVPYPGDKALLTRWPEAKIGAVRLWDSGTLWADIAAQPGQWNYDRMDAYVELAAAHNAAVLYTLGGTPRWASARPDETCAYGLGCAAEPVKMAHWEEYVRRVAQRYRGRIAMYELWNEPSFSDIARDRGRPGFYTGDVANMVEMARIARKVLDEVDPGAILSTPGFVSGPDRLDLFLAAGGKQYIQAVAYHFYAVNAGEFVQRVLEVRAIMKRHGLEGLPLWNTETGLEVYPSDQPLPPGVQNQTPAQAASLMAQFLVLGAATGLERFYYYAWDNGLSGMFSPAGVRQPAWDAYEKVQSWLLGARMSGCAAMPPNGVRCQGELAGQRFLIVWADKEAMYHIPVPSGQRAVAVEKLLSASQPITETYRFPQMLLASEPVRILFESKQ